MDLENGFKTGFRHVRMKAVYMEIRLSNEIMENMMN